MQLENDIGQLGSHELESYFRMDYLPFEGVHLCSKYLYGGMIKFSVDKLKVMHMKTRTKNQPEHTSSVLSSCSKANRMLRLTRRGLIETEENIG